MTKDASPNETVRRYFEGVDLVIGRRLRLARLSAGISEAQIGKAIGVSVRALRQYEAGARRFSAERLAMVAQVLDRPLSHFFSDEPWLATQLGLDVLLQPRHAGFRELLAHWRENRGRLSDGFFGAVAALGMSPRTALVRRRPNSSDLVHEYVPTGLLLMTPCQWLNLMGRDVEELPERAYGAWVKRVYLDVLAKGRPRIDSVRLMTHATSGAAVYSFYERLALPWQRGRADFFVSAVSIRREFSITQ